MKDYLSRTNVTVEEGDSQTIIDNDGMTVTVVSSWVATHDGRMRSLTSEQPPFNGMRVILSRTGKNATHALENLQTAAEEQGWELK